MTNAGHNPTSVRRSLRRGATLLEVVLASVILGLVAVSVTSAISFVTRSDMVGQMRLGAHELANRILLQYCDDKKLLPSSFAAYFDGRYNYRWELEEEPLKFELPDNSIMEMPPPGHGRGAINETKLLRVRVYHGVADGVGGHAKGDLLAEIIRPYNPMMMLSGTPDARDRRMRDPDFLRTLQAIMAGGGSVPPTSSPPTGAAPPGAPPPPTPGARP